MILAEASIGQTEDRLRALIFDPKTPDFWTMRLKPTDMAPFKLQAVDVDGARRTRCTSARTSSRRARGSRSPTTT